MNILGIWDGHDSGAALLQDGRLRFAVNEERLTPPQAGSRVSRRARSRPASRIAGLAPGADRRRRGLDLRSGQDARPAGGPAARNATTRSAGARRRPGPLAALTRALKYRMTEWSPGPRLDGAEPDGAAARSSLDTGLTRATLRLVDHHEAHAAAAAWASGFAPCAVLTIDGLGDGLSATISAFRDGRLERVAASPARSSLGVFFEHVTNLLNMRELEDEGKVMALADYAAPIADADNPLLPLGARPGRRHRDRAARARAAAHAGARSTGGIANEQFAYLAQRVVEHACVRAGPRCRAAHRASPARAGRRRRVEREGDAAGPAAARKWRTSTCFPHMGDGGLALGRRGRCGRRSRASRFDSISIASISGPPTIDAAIEASASRRGPPADACRRTCRAASPSCSQTGRIVMWFQGAMEYGPRALGHRSVLARPDRLDLRDRLNLVLKRRVWYQPFCPSMLESEAPRLLADWTGGRNRVDDHGVRGAPEHRAAIWPA